MQPQPGRRPFEIARFENDLMGAINYVTAIENDKGEASLRPMRLAHIKDVLQRMLDHSREDAARAAR